MKNGNVICILAKSPRPGRVKTQLECILGNKRAALLSRALLMDTISTALKIPRSEITIAFWPAENRADFEDIIYLFQHEEPNAKISLRASGISLVPQAGQTPGERLRVLSQGFFECGARYVIFVCSDNPLLDPAIIKASFELLKLNRAVVGPTFDGGYYLLGINGPYPTLFESIDWAAGNVYRQLAEKLDIDGESWQELEIFYDVDRPEELEQLCSDIDNLRLTGKDDLCRHTEKYLVNLKK